MGYNQDIVTKSTNWEEIGQTNLSLMRNDHPGHPHNCHRAQPNNVTLTANFHNRVDNPLDPIFEDWRLKKDSNRRCRSALYESRFTTGESCESYSTQSSGCLVDRWGSPRPLPSHPPRLVATPYMGIALWRSCRPKSQSTRRLNEMQFQDEEGFDSIPSLVKNVQLPEWELGNK